MIIETILLLILFFCGITAISFQQNKKSDFLFLILKRAVFVIFVHALHVFICEYFFPGIRYYDSAAPYGLLYGPLLYLTILGLKKNSLKSNVWKIHLIPFIVFYIFYLLLVLNPNVRADCLHSFLKTLYTAIPISFLTYVIAAVFIKNKKLKQSDLLRIQEFFITMAMILFFMALFFFIARYTGEKESYSSRLIVYCSMLIAIINIFIFQIKDNKNSLKLNEPIYEFSSSDFPKYTKSKITEEQLNDYEEKLFRMMEEQHLFLDVELSLDKLAKELKIPTYHLTQLFSLRIGKNFNQFVNTYRINFACTMMDTTKDLKIDTLIFECGFNSKTSFNRHFKMMMGVTPSEYSSNKNDKIIY